MSSLDQYIDVLHSIDDDLKGRQIDKFFATTHDRKQYSKQIDMFAAGKHFTERAVLGANRVGKTHLAAYECALHATGQYPDWWPGYKFTRPVTIWACGTTRDQSRDVQQDKLLGPPHAIGTGLIPKNTIASMRRRQGVQDAFDSFQVQHVSGGLSTIQFKSYQERREGFQGRRIDFVWLDEEPSLSIFGECLLRTTATSKFEKPGRLLLTVTPIDGWSEVIEQFFDQGQLQQSGNRYADCIGWLDAPHISKQDQAKMLESIHEWEVEPRTKGWPALGSGRVYRFIEDDVVIPPFKIPPYFQRAYAIDPGWRYTAVIWMAWDAENEVYYVVNEYKKGDTEVYEHAELIRNRSRFQRGCIDPASAGSSQIDGRSVRDIYRQEGLNLTDANNRVDSGLMTVQDLFATGRLKIFDTCTLLLAELRKYSRDQRGKIRKIDDHLCDCLRYCVGTKAIFRAPRPYSRPRVIRAMK